MVIDLLLQAYVDRVLKVVPTNSLPEDSKKWTSSQIAFCLEWVEKLEETIEFKELATRRDDPFETEHKLPSTYRFHLKTFFRRCGFYLDAISGRGSADIVVSAHREQFAAEEATPYVRRLAPLDSVWFPNDHITFRGFSIRRFSVLELDEILQSRTNVVFYPDALVDSKEIRDFWFVDTKGEERGRRVRLWGLDPEVPKPFTGFASDLENAFRALALWDWEESASDVPIRPRKSADPSKGWRKPAVPFVLTIPDDLRRRPVRCPKLTGVESGFDIDPESGEEYSYPLYDHSIEDGKMFEDLVRNAERFVDQISKFPTWSFLPVALGFLMKAFFSDGIEELLWHTVTVEALVGEDSERGGLSGLLERRIGRILGPEAKKRFREIYELRSQFVHGDAAYVSNPLFQLDLRDARRIARELSFWFLLYADHINTHLAPGSQPLRTELLKPLDMENTSLGSLREVLSQLPHGFPKFVQESL
jgi:hypothetical protein